MGSTVFTGDVLAIRDHEDDYLMEVVGTNRIVGISNLIREAGGTTVPTVIPDAFEAEDLPTDHNDFYAGHREGFREEHNRFSPPILRVKITVEVEPLTDEEATVIWAQHMAEVRKIREGDNEQDVPG